MTSYCRGDEFLRVTRSILETGDLELFTRYLLREWRNPALCELLASESLDARKVALFGLSLIGTVDDCPSIIPRLRDSDTYVVRLAEHTLWSIWLRGKHPEAQARLQNAVLMIAHGQLHEAIHKLCALIAEYPDFAEAYNQRAIAEFLIGEYDRARRDLRETLRLNPLHFAAIAELGHCDAAEGDCEQALVFYRKALEIHPQVEGLRQAIKELQDHLAQPNGDSCSLFLD